MADQQISLDIEDDKLFLLHFVIGTYFGPDFKDHHPNKNQSAFQVQAQESTPYHSKDLTASPIKRAHLERVYHYILNTADPSLIAKPRLLRQYFNGDLPFFRHLFPRKLHPESRVGNRYKLIQSIASIHDPDTSCMTPDCIARFKRLTGLHTFTLSLDIPPDEVEAEIVESLEEKEPAGNRAAHLVGLMDIGECADAYLFRVSLPGVKRDERDFSCQVEDNGKVLVRGVTTTGEKRVRRYAQLFEMQTQNLCPPGHFSVSFHLPGPVNPHEFSGSFGTDGILEGIVMKNLRKQFL